MARRSSGGRISPHAHPSSNDLATLTAALAYAERGIPVFPVNRAKEPLTPHGFKDASTDAETIKAWWNEHPDAGVAVPTGAVSGLVVVDLDPRNGCETTLQKIEREHGAFPVTVTSRTGGGGSHLFYRHPGGGIRIKSGNGALGEGVDLKADGGYVVAPPSGHESGGWYSWIMGHSIDERGFTPVPEWIVVLRRDRAKTSTDTKPVAPAPTAPAPGKLREGGRNAGLTSMAGTMRRRGMNEASILAALREENKAECTPPLGDDEVRTIAGSVARYEPEAPSSGDAARPIEEPHYTDTGNAERFVRDHAGDVLFCHPWNRWLVWDGVRWARDERGGIASRVKSTLCAMHENAGRLIFGDEERKRLAKHALASESERARGAMIELAKCELPVVPEELDADPMLFNAQNGMIRLTDGKLYPHDRGEKITKCAGTIYDPHAECPGWLAFLDRCFAGDADLIGYMQRALGYSLTGDTSEEVFFVGYGTGANGKSTLFGVVQEIMGDYATTTRAETVLAKRNPESIPNDVAALLGARFVTAIEAEEGRRLASGLVKSMTGRDKLSARFMRSEFFEFVPSFKLWLGVNHKPRIRDSSPAMWRRVKLIPFTVTIPVPDQDPGLRDKLLTEAPGILAWLVGGCVAWKAHRLGSCAAVDKATRAYRDESNTVVEWVALACTVARGASATHAELFGAFKVWCEREGEEPLGARAFGDRLEEAFAVVKRVPKVGRDRGYSGISLKSEGVAS